jgi:hypothetical protein
MAYVHVRWIQDPQRAQQPLVAGSDGETVELDRIVQDADGIRGRPGMREVNDDLAAGQQRAGPAGDHVQGAEVGDSQGSAHFDAGRQQVVIDVDMDLKPVLGEGAIHGDHTSRAGRGRVCWVSVVLCMRLRFPIPARRERPGQPCHSPHMARPLTSADRGSSPDVLVGTARSGPECTLQPLL